MDFVIVIASFFLVAELPENLPNQLNHLTNY